MPRGQQQRPPEPQFQLTQKGFGGGELGPQLLGRSDLQKYASGLLLCRNFTIQRHGAAENRAGTLFKGLFKQQSAFVRLVPFHVDASHSYLIEFGNAYGRVWKNGSLVSTVGAAAWAIGTTYAVGALVTYAGVVYYSRTNLNLAQQPDVSPGSWYPQTAGVMEFPTTIPQATLQIMQYVQPNAVMTLTAQGFSGGPVTLTFGGSDTSWMFQQFTAGAPIGPPGIISLIVGVPPTGGAQASACSALTATGGDAGLTKSQYVVVAWASTSQQQFAFGSAPILATATVGGADAGNPVAISFFNPNTSPAVFIALYRLVFPNYELIHLFFPGGSPGTLTLSDNGITPITPVIDYDTAGDPFQQFSYVITSIAAATGEESAPSNPVTGSGGVPSASQPNQLVWTLVPGASEYNVYRSVNGTYGFIGQTSGLSTPQFVDDNITPLTSVQPPVPIPMNQTSNDFPGVVAYFQDRLIFANSINNPNRIWMAQPGTAANFNVLTPVVASSAIELDLVSKTVQTVTAIVDNGRLIIHTASGEFICSGDTSGAITPEAINPNRQGSSGSSYVQPVVIPPTDIFVQARGGQMRDLRYEIQSTGYTGKDLTAFSPQMFLDRTIQDMAWQQIKNSIIWCIMDDGQLYGITYIREQAMEAWHHHDTTNGSFESLAVVPENAEDALYVSVVRTIEGATVRYLERFANREFADSVYLSDAYFCDSAQIYDGRNTNTGVTVTASGSPTTRPSPIDLNFSSGSFTSAFNGSAIVLQQLDPVTGLVLAQVTITITKCFSTTHLQGTADQDLPAWALLPMSTWGKAVSSFSMMDHLDGQTISMLGDGAVLPQQVVSAGGAFTTPLNVLVLCAGLPIQSQLETLPVENAEGNSLTARPVIVNQVTIMFYQTVGGKYGQSFQALEPWQQRTIEPLSSPTALYTGPAIIPIAGDWQRTGQICIQLDDPLPMGLSAITPSGFAGEG